MRRFRFHIGSLLILVVVLGIGFAALREASEIWDSIVLSTMAGVLLVAVLLAIHRRAEKRAFWVGFALLGWGYLVLTMIASIEPRLLTTKALAYLDSKVSDRPVTITGQAWGGPVNNSGQTVATVAFSPQGNLIAGTTNSTSIRLWNTTTASLLSSGSGTTENFLHIGHALCALILAWLGGKLSRRLYIGGQEVRQAPDNP